MDDYVPLAKNDDAVVTQYTMTTLEELGLLKMDFLGLRNLTVLDDAVKMVRSHEPGLSDLHAIPDDDPEAFQMLSDGRTSRRVPDGIGGDDRGVRGAAAHRTLRTSPPSSPSTGRAPWNPSPGSSPASTTRTASHYKHPSLVPILSSHLRLHRLPGAGH